MAIAKFLNESKSLSKSVFLQTLTRLHLVPEEQIELQQIDAHVEQVAGQVVTEVYAGVREQADPRILVEASEQLEMKEQVGQKALRLAD